uniref:Prothrombin n=1 Tax=Aceria tosichella TaxID=561515 RepID=A0A6G1SFR1_9ACAR
MAAANHIHNSSHIRASRDFLMVAIILVSSSSLLLCLCLVDGRRIGHTLDGKSSGSNKREAKDGTATIDWTKFQLPKKCGQMRPSKTKFPGMIWGPECRKEGRNRRQASDFTSSSTVAHERVAHVGCVDQWGDAHFPSFVYLVKKTTYGKEQLCSGVLISSYLVLTAFHCVAYTIGNTAALDEIGVIRSTRFAPGQNIIDIDRVIGGNLAPETGSKDYNDVAIVVLKEPQDVSDGSAACLPSGNMWPDKTGQEKYLLTNGGIIKKLEDVPIFSSPSVPTWASLSTLRNEACRFKKVLTGKEVTLEEASISCFSINKHPQEKRWGLACGGDSGAPIYKWDTYAKQFVVIGIMSRGHGSCGSYEEQGPNIGFAVDLYKIARLGVLQKQLEKVGELS